MEKSRACFSLAIGAITVLILGQYALELVSRDRAATVYGNVHGNMVTLRIALLDHLAYEDEFPQSLDELASYQKLSKDERASVSMAIHSFEWVYDPSSDVPLFLERDRVGVSCFVAGKLPKRWVMTRSGTITHQ